MQIYWSFKCHVQAIDMTKIRNISQTKEKITSFLAVTQNNVHTNSLGKKITMEEKVEILK